MSILDQPSVDWTCPKATELRDLFVSAYLWEDSAVDLANSAGIVPGTFQLHVNMRTTWTRLIEVMARQGKLRAMVEKAADDATIAGFEIRFQEMLTDNPAVSTIQAKPTDDWWKGRDKDPKLRQQAAFTAPDYESEAIPQHRSGTKSGRSRPERRQAESELPIGTSLWYRFPYTEGSTVDQSPQCNPQNIWRHQRNDCRVRLRTRLRRSTTGAPGAGRLDREGRGARLGGGSVGAFRRPGSDSFGNALAYCQ